VVLSAAVDGVGVGVPGESIGGGSSGDVLEVRDDVAGRIAAGDGVGAEVHGDPGGVGRVVDGVAVPGRVGPAVEGVGAARPGDVLEVGQGVPPGVSAGG